MKSILVFCSLFLCYSVATAQESKFALYAQSTASQKLESKNNTEEIVTFVQDDIVINNICAFDKTQHTFSVQKAGTYEITASISFNPFIYKPIITTHKNDQVTIVLLIKTSTDNLITSKIVSVKKHVFGKGSLNVASTILTVPTTVFLEENEKIAVFVQQDPSSTLQINSESEAHISRALGMAVSKAIRILKK